MGKAETSTVIGSPGTVGIPHCLKWEFYIFYPMRREKMGKAETRKQKNYCLKSLIIPQSNGANIRPKFLDVRLGERGKNKKKGGRRRGKRKKQMRYRSRFF